VLFALSAFAGQFGCGFIGYDELAQPCSGMFCTGQDPVQSGGDDGGLLSSGDNGNGDGQGGDGDVGIDILDGGNRPGELVDGSVRFGDGPYCGSMQRLHEDFDGGREVEGFVERWYGGARFALENDRLEMKLGTGASAEATYRSAQVWDLRGSELALELGAGGQVSGFALREGALEQTDDPPIPLHGGL
jgi:hypothetical protein